MVKRNANLAVSEDKDSLVELEPMHGSGFWHRQSRWIVCLILFLELSVLVWMFHHSSGTSHRQTQFQNR
jgi:hypothetical protein